MIFIKHPKKNKTICVYTVCSQFAMQTAEQVLIHQILGLNMQHKLLVNIMFTLNNLSVVNPNSRTLIIRIKFLIFFEMEFKEYTQKPTKLIYDDKYINKDAYVDTNKRIYTY